MKPAAYQELTNDLITELSLLLVLSGRPIAEPLVQYGPFVMNTKNEIERALKDFQSQSYVEGLTRA